MWSTVCVANGALNTHFQVNFFSQKQVVYAAAIAVKTNLAIFSPISLFAQSTVFMNSSCENV